MDVDRHGVHTEMQSMEALRRRYLEAHPEVRQTSMSEQDNQGAREEQEV